MTPDISVVVSFSRPQFFEDFFKSIAHNECSFELIMVGINPPEIKDKRCRFIETKVKPAQCWEIGLREAKGKLVHWTADDAEYSPFALDYAVEFYNMIGNSKVVVTLQTIENGCNITKNHKFFQGQDTPLMAPLGVIDRELYRSLGGIDKNFICGQWENDLTMRIYEAGGDVRIAPMSYVRFDHIKKHGHPSILSVAFELERKFLESAWVKDGKLQKTRNFRVEFFEEGDILKYSQGKKTIEYEGKVLKEW